MPMYVTVTPLRDGGPEPLAPGTPTEMDADQGEALVALGALEPGDDDVVPPPPAAPAPKPLAKQSRDELVATATVEEVEFAEDATKAQLMAAIEAKRAESAA